MENISLFGVDVEEAIMSHLIKHHGSLIEVSLSSIFSAG
jgi:hypothetical protein